MGEFIKAAKQQDIEEGKGIVADCAGTPVAIFKIGGNLHAIHNTCVHRGGPLGEGECEGTIVTCPWHGWRYDVTTGQSPDNPKAQVRCYQLKLEGDDIFVEL
jgi:nitrite reductase/ring-hydroxylating ferredoxin subunit